MPTADVNKALLSIPGDLFLNLPQPQTRSNARGFGARISVTRGPTTRCTGPDSSTNPVVRPGNLPFEQDAVEAATVVRQGDTYRLWYAGLIFRDLKADPVVVQAAGIGEVTWTPSR